MTTVFDQLAASLGPYVGGTLIAGVLLGTALAMAIIVTILLVASWASRGQASSEMTLIVAAGLGVGIATLVGWYPWWLPVFIFVLAIFAWLRPLGSSSGA